jgi:DNA-directed RNA polymerase specialized sigma24 family protein
MAAMNPPDETRLLLQRWHAGERAAIETLVARDLGWIRDYVHERLGPLLRSRGETMDYVQDAVLDVMRYTPRFVTDDRRQFRGLLARIVENHLRDAHDHHAAARRTPLRERPVPSDSVLDLDGRQRAITQPGAGPRAAGAATGAARARHGAGAAVVRSLPAAGQLIGSDDCGPGRNAGTHPAILPPAHSPAQPVASTLATTISFR